MWNLASGFRRVTEFRRPAVKLTVRVWKQRVWRDEQLTKRLLCSQEDLSLSLRTPVTKSGVGVGTCNLVLERGKRQIPGTRWPVTFPYLASFRPMRDPDSKVRVKASEMV